MNLDHILLGKEFSFSCLFYVVLPFRFQLSCGKSVKQKFSLSLTMGRFWPDILKISNHFLSPEMPLNAFWWGKYDITIQSHSLLLAFLSSEEQDTFSGGLEKEANYQLPFLTAQRRASTNIWYATSPSAPQRNVLFRWDMPNVLW